METYVDRRIDEFLEDSKQGLRQLQESLGQLVGLRDMLLEPDKTATGRDRQKLSEAFRLVGKRAGRLRKQLSMVFPLSLRLRSELEPELDRDPEKQLLETELIEISTRLEMVDRQLQDYLFSNRPVVNVMDLAERDILVLLNEISKISRLAERTLSTQ